MDGSWSDWQRISYDRYLELQDARDVETTEQRYE
jgi:hypothetical protein